MPEATGMVIYMHGNLAVLCKMLRSDLIAVGSGIQCCQQQTITTTTIVAPLTKQEYKSIITSILYGSLSIAAYLAWAVAVS